MQEGDSCALFWPSWYTRQHAKPALAAQSRYYHTSWPGQRGGAVVPPRELRSPRAPRTCSQRTDRARGDAVLDFCRAHGVRHIGVEDLVLHRVRTDPLLEPVAATAGGPLRVRAFRERVSGKLHVTVPADDAGGAGGRFSVHRHCPAGYLLGPAVCDCGQRITGAVEEAKASGGVVLVLNVDFAGLRRALAGVRPRERRRRDRPVSRRDRRRADPAPPRRRIGELIRRARAGR